LLNINDDDTDEEISAKVKSIAKKMKRNESTKNNQDINNQSKR